MEVCFEYDSDYESMRTEDSHKRSEYAGESSPKTLVKTPVAIIAVLKKNNSLSLVEVAQQIGKFVSAVERAAKKLVKHGKLKYIGPQKGGHWEIIDE